MNLQGSVILGEDVAHNVEEEAQNIWDHGDEENEFGELGGAPRAFQIAAAIEDRESGSDETKDILLDGRGQEEDPWVNDGYTRYNGEVWQAMADLGQRLCSAFGPAGDGAEGEVEEGEEHDSGEQATCEWREVEGAGHGGERRGGGRMRASTAAAAATAAAVHQAVGRGVSVDVDVGVQWAWIGFRPSFGRGDAGGRRVIRPGGLGPMGLACAR